MSDYIQQLRGGTLVASLWAPATWIGPIGCVLLDTDIWSLRLQDGSTPGGHIIGGTASITIPLPYNQGGTGLTGPYTDGQLLIGDSLTSGFLSSVLTPGTGITVTNGHGSITISLVVPVSTADGGTGLTGTYSNGQLLIGNGTTLTAATLTAGAGVTIANSAGGITISASASGAPGAPWTVIDVTGSVSSYTVSLTTTKTLVVWRVASTGTKTTVIPAAGATNNGYDVEVKTTQGNGDTHNIVPVSGTVEGSSTLTFTDAAGTLHYAIRMTSDGGFTDWVVT